MLICKNQFILKEMIIFCDNNAYHGIWQYDLNYFIYSHSRNFLLIITGMLKHVIKVQRKQDGGIMVSLLNTF